MSAFNYLPHVLQSFLVANTNILTRDVGRKKNPPVSRVKAIREASASGFSHFQCPHTQFRRPRGEHLSYWCLQLATDIIWNQRSPPAGWDALVAGTDSAKTHLNAGSQSSSSTVDTVAFWVSWIGSNPVVQLSELLEELTVSFHGWSPGEKAEEVRREK